MCINLSPIYLSIIELVQTSPVPSYISEIWENEVNHEHHKGDCFT